MCYCLGFLSAYWLLVVLWGGPFPTITRCFWTIKNIYGIRQRMFWCSLFFFWETTMEFVVFTLSECHDTACRLSAWCCHSEAPLRSSWDNLSRRNARSFYSQAVKSMMRKHTLEESKIAYEYTHSYMFHMNNHTSFRKRVNLDAQQKHRLSMVKRGELHVRLKVWFFE